MKIAILTQFNAPFREVANITLPALVEYSERHDYELIVGEDLGINRSIIWDRYRHLHAFIDNYDWVVHFDSDVLITNHHIRLEEFMEKGSIVMAKCECEDGKKRINDGVALFKNTPAVKLVIWDAYTATETDIVKCGQDAISELERAQSLIHFERHKALQSFDYTLYSMPETTLGHWTPGDFSLHLPGCSNEKRVEIFTQRQQQVLR